MSNETKHSYVPIITAIVCLIVSIGLFFKIQTTAEPPGERIPTRFELATLFTGKIKIIYDYPDAESLVEKDGYRVVSVPLSGQVQTSSPMLYGTAKDVFVRETVDEGWEDLGPHFIKLRKNGVVGDSDEFFEESRELEQRDKWLEERGIDVSVPEEAPRYELIIIRDDFD